MLFILMLIGAALAAATAGHTAAAIILTAVALALFAGPRATSPRLAGETGDISTFVPEFWVRTLLRKLRHSHIFGQPQVANRDYEGVIRQAGDTVKINSVGEVTIKDYTRNEDIDSPEELDTDLTTLQITEEKYFNFAVDDVDAAQAAGDVLGGGMESAAFGLRDVADQFLASFHTDVDADNRIGTDEDPVEISDPSHAYFYLNRLALRLDDANVVSEGRFAVVPNWFGALLALDKRFTSAADLGSGGVTLNGQVGRAAGFNILQSANAPTGTDGGDPEVINTKVIAGVPMALSFAEQINKTVAYQPDNRFADAVKGLHVYGGKLVYPKAWAVGSFVDGVGDTPPE